MNTTSHRATYFFCLLFLVVGGCQAESTIALLPDNDPDHVRPIPPPGIEVPAANQDELKAGLAKLGAILDEIRPKQWNSANIESRIGAAMSDVRDREFNDESFRLAYFADVEIFHRAVRVALEDQEIFDVKEIEAAKMLLEIGMQRAEQLKKNQAPWDEQTGIVIRGYVSRIDGTPQPYAVVIPGAYDFSIKKRSPNNISEDDDCFANQPYRLDVWLHGRDERLSELSFISKSLSNPGPINPADAFVLYPYGRYCNANKFAGETDVIDTTQILQYRYRIHPYRVAIRGFSMGGAACWHLAAHYPFYWFAATPGAGFAETPEYLRLIKNEKLSPTWWEEKLWQWYDCPGYAANLRHLPVIAYSGENDAQKQAADEMEAAFEREGMNLTHLIGPDTGHSIHPEIAKEIDSKLATWINSPPPEATPTKYEFVTYSLMHFYGDFVLVLGLEEHWKEARVIAEQREDGGLRFTTTNVTALIPRLDTLPGLRAPIPKSWAKKTKESFLIIDGQKIDGKHFAAAKPIDLVKKNGQWQISPNEQPKQERPEIKKRYWSCGPIDHAFMSSFIFVKPTKPCAHPAVQKWVDDEMNRAITQWRRFFRGDVMVKADTEVTSDEIQSMHLILWGDRRSNSLIEKIAERLPIRWTDANITVGNQKFDAANHALIAIYPNPLHPRHYIVLNSGFTFREYDYLTNARQTPKLPDWAVVDLRTPPNSRWPGKIVAADFFDEEWKLKPAKK